MCASCASVKYNAVTLPQHDSTPLTSFEENQGDLLYRQSKEAFGIVEDDPQALRRIETQAKKIIPHLHRPNISYSFYVLDKTEELAYAGFDGGVYISRGMLALVKSDEVLAALLAHELAHHSLKHNVSTYKRMAYTDKPKARRKMMADYTVTLLSLGILQLNERGRELAAEQKYSLVDEMHADMLGAYYLHRSGLRPEAMIDLMEELKKIKGSQPPFLYQHPPHEKRKDFIQRYIRETLHAQTD